MCFLTNLNALSFIPLDAVLHILKGEEEALQLTGGNMTTATLPILLLLLQGSLIINHEIKISQLLSLVSRESNCLTLESTRPQPQKAYSFSLIVYKELFFVPLLSELTILLSYF